MRAMIQCGFVLPHPCQDRPETRPRLGEDKWKQQSAEWRADMQVGADVKPWTSHEGFQGNGFKHTDRSLELLDLVAVQTLISSGLSKSINKVGSRLMKKQLGNVLVDLSQNPVRRCFTKNGKSPCLTTSSQIYSFGRDSLLVPLEYMILQGHKRTIAIPDGMSGKQVKELAGEGMSLPCLALIVWCLVLVNRLP